MIINLSPREQEIMSLVIKGYSNKYIAENLFLTEQTVNVYLNKIYNKYCIEADNTYNRRVRAAFIFNLDKIFKTVLNITEKGEIIQKSIKELEDEYIGGSDEY